jgi:hypothetical protein
MNRARISVRALAALAVLATSVALLGGCAQKAAPQPQSTDPLAGVTAAPLTQMTPAEKASSIATSFPIQVPVAAGEVRRGEAQSPSAWVYQVVVPGDVKSVQRWYLDVYSGSEWRVISRTADSLQLQKVRAQSHLRFEPVSGDKPKTLVTAGVGVGTQVLQTQ